MLEKLTLKNFQCHQKITIELDPLITCIVGKSDAGKSAIIRALCWLSRNKPDGEDFIRHGETLCSVHLQADSRVVKRVRGGGRNKYVYDSKEFKAFGRGVVPEEIEKFLNIGEINFQSQHDAAFWFSKSAGEVAKELNSVVNLSLIDKILSSLSSKLRKAKTKVEVSQERLNKAKKEQASLAWVQDAERHLVKIEALEESLAQIRSKRLSMEALYNQATQTASRLESLSERLLGASKAIRAGERLLAKTQEIESLENLWQEISSTQIKVRSLKKKRENLEEELGKMVGVSCPLCGRTNEAKNISR